MKVDVLSPQESAERSARFRASGLSRDEFERADAPGRDTALFFWHPDSRGFSWLCPGCLCWYYGPLGDKPVSGWDAPQWVNSGTEESPTLIPSLGCPGWRRGTCPAGHYWMRDGELVNAS